jgi:hypothetical protein
VGQTIALRGLSFGGAHKLNKTILTVCLSLARNRINAEADAIHDAMRICDSEAQRGPRDNPAHVRRSWGLRWDRICARESSLGVHSLSG